MKRSFFQFDMFGEQGLLFGSVHRKKRFEKKEIWKLSLDFLQIFKILLRRRKNFIIIRYSDFKIRPQNLKILISAGLSLFPH
jgi:hypothetical protein